MAMLFGRNEHKGLLIPQYSKDNVAKLVHHSAKGRHFGLTLAFFLVIAAKDRILRFPVYA